MKYIQKIAFFHDKNLNQLRGRKKIQYIWNYYKLPLAILCIIVYVFSYLIYGKLTYKDTILYTALVNVNAGSNLTNGLTTDFLDFLNLNTSKNKLELYTGLYLTDNEKNTYHEYSYASRIKILAAIDGEMLDIVLMNQEAFDTFSQNGYLCNLEELFLQKNPALYHSIKSNFVNNIVILEDNSIDLALDSSISYHAITEEHPFGLNLSHTKLIQQAEFEETVYLGIVANSPRMDTVVTYLQYLFSNE